MKDYKIEDLQVIISCCRVKMISQATKLINALPKICHACSFSILTVQNSHKYYNSQPIKIINITTQLLYYIKGLISNSIGKTMASQIILSSMNLCFHMKQHISETWLMQGLPISFSSSRNCLSRSDHFFNNLILNNTKMVAIWHLCMV